MAIQPGTYNFTLQRRSDHSIPLLFKDENDGGSEARPRNVAMMYIIKI